MEPCFKGAWDTKGWHQLFLPSSNQLKSHPGPTSVEWRGGVAIPNKASTWTWVTWSLLPGEGVQKHELPKDSHHPFAEAGRELGKRWFPEALVW